MTDRVGCQQLGNYRLIRLLGRGGFAEVYLGEHIHLGTPAAIKVLHVQVGESELEHFRNEARIIARLDHPHIVRVLDFGVESDFPFLVMTYAPGGTLHQRHPKGEQLPLTTILSYVKQITNALQYLHEKKLVHRDIKPENMLLGSDGKLLLSDFGIAVVAHTTGSLIIQGQAGTPPYMAPEQIMKKPCAASDQYALGVVVYQWLCGSRPFPGSLGEVLKHHLETLPPAIRECRPTIPAAVEAVVLKALTKNPKQRFESVQAFAAALKQAHQENEQLPCVPPSQQSSSQTLLVSPLPVPSLPPNVDLPFHHSVPSPEEVSLPRLPFVPFKMISVPNQSSFSPSHTIPVPKPLSLPAITTISSSRSPQPPMEVSPVMGSPELTRETVPGVSPIQAKEATFTPSEQREVAAIPVPASQAFQQEIAPVRQRRPNLPHHRVSRRTMVLGLGLAGLALGGGGITWFVTQHPVLRHTTITPLPKVSPTATSIPLGTILSSYNGHGDASVTAVAWSPNGRRIASGGDDQTVQVWDATNGGHVYSYRGHSDVVVTLAWSPDSGRIISSDRKTIQAWNAIDGANPHLYSGNVGSASWLAWSPIDQRIASCDFNGIGSTQLWNAADGDHPYIFGTNGNNISFGSVFEVAWSPEGKRIAQVGNGPVLVLVAG